MWWIDRSLLVVRSILYEKYYYPLGVSCEWLSEKHYLMIINNKYILLMRMMGGRERERAVTLNRNQFHDTSASIVSSGPVSCHRGLFNHDHGTDFIKPLNWCSIQSISIFSVQVCGIEFKMTLWTWRTRLVRNTETGIRNES